MPAHEVASKQTHMSWVFLAGDKAYKLKKPVRFPYLDYSTLAKREAACRAELTLNRRLAPDVYEQVVPLTQSPRGLSLGGAGEIADWLVVMRRLDENRTLEQRSNPARSRAWQLDRVVATLVAFYRRAHAVFVSPESYLANWRRSLAYNKRILLDPRFALPAGLIRRIDAAQRRFLNARARLIAERVRGRHIVDGHGDLRPEHILLGDPVIIIDCLEFNACLRAVDPFDEIAYLCVECDRLGAPGRANTSGAAPSMRCAITCRTSCSRFIAATARRCARGCPSRICWSRTRARRRSGRGSPATICASRRPTPCAWSACSKHEQVGKRAAVVQAADGFRQQRRDAQGVDLAARARLQPERRHAVGARQSGRWPDRRSPGWRPA